MAAYFARFEGGSCTFDLDGPSVMTLRVKALQETQKAIEDPDRCVSLGVIAAIISSILEAVSILQKNANQISAPADMRKSMFVVIRPRASCISLVYAR